MTVDVIIPTCRPGPELRELLLRLERQTVRPRHILLVNTEKSLFDERLVEGLERAEVVHIRRQEFDHGGTRHMAAMRMDGEFLLFLTQDALPADRRLIECLLRPFADPRVGVSYARQLPRKDCSVLERYARRFNYGSVSRVKTAADLPELGVKTFFCSNVCAMYRRSAYLELGGFERRTIFNEDMIFAGKLTAHGGAVAYCADARVIHSHNYTAAQQFRRNFDLGVSQAQHPEVFAGIRSESEGVRMVAQTARWLLRTGRLRLLPELAAQTACKYLGYRLGKRYQRLPRRMILACTMNRDYWR